MRGRLIGAILAAVVIVAVLLPDPAGAKQISPYHFDSTFDGTGSTGGKFTNRIHNVAVNDSNGNLYVSDEQAAACPGGTSFPQTITQLSESGQPQPFSGLAGVSTLCVGNQFTFGQVPLSFDNTGHNGGLFWTKGRVFNFSSSGVLNPNYPVFVGVSPIDDYQEVQTSDIDTAPDGSLWVATENGIRKRDPATGANLGGKADYWADAYPNLNRARRMKIDSNGYVYFSNGAFGPGVKKFAPVSQLEFDNSKLFGTTPKLAEFGPRFVRAIAIDRSNDDVYLLEGSSEEFSGDEVTEYTSDGAKVESFGLAEGPYAGLTEAEGIAVNSNTHAVYVARGGATPGIDVLKQGPAVIVPDTTTLAAEPATTSAVLKGTVNPDGVETTECRFEWGTTPQYSGEAKPCSEGNAFNGMSDAAVSASLIGLTKGQTYHYRISAKNANGFYSYGVDQTFEAAGTPVLSPPVVVGEVNTDGSIFESEIDPNGGRTSYWIEYGTGDCSVSTCSQFPVEGQKLNSNLGVQNASIHLEGLVPDTEYHFRLVAKNGTGTAATADQTFRTFPTNPAKDSCPNVQVRQQTGASYLMDCRAYELVSAGNAGGYDVESNVVPGQKPLPTYPQAKDSVLYALHFGLIPGVGGSPTNYERDPYLATRGPDGWSTRYVGVPATAGGGQSEPFGSPLAGASSDLTTFAFGGPRLCSPCFEDGSTGIPVRLPDGRLVQGMAGSLDPGSGAAQAGFVKQPLSADGTHLIFASTAQFESDANDSGDVTVYERNLIGETTQVVSRTPAGATMSGTDIGELDVSSDGSRVLIGRKIGPPDSAGNQSYHLYMKIEGTPASLDLTPTTSSGVLFTGMTGDGTRVFFTTKDALLGSDTDTSVDLYEARIEGGSVDVNLLSTGSGNGNTDSCSPPGSPSWNAVEGEGHCNVVAIAGGGGVASDDGTIYFLSPELLDGSSGEAGQPNLYVVRPGSNPRYVSTLEPDNPLIEHGVRRTEVRDSADFQVTPDGEFASFSSTLPLTGYLNRGHSEIYRYTARPGDEALDCVSCAPTNAAATTDAYLTSGGLNLIPDGRVFFDSREALVLRDRNSLQDVYEWADGRTELISTGTGVSDVGLLSASSNGVDVFFFTRQSLAQGDENGNAMKVYDAREGGGFLFIPGLHPCAASDECHGPGTPIPAQPAINTVTGQGAQGGQPSKPKRKKHHHRKHRRKRHRKAHHG